MGLIGRLRSFFRTVLSGDNVSQGTVDLGAGHVVYADHFSAPGDDSHPLDDDYCIALSNGREEGFAVVGYVDQRNAGVAAKGEKRIYGRDSAGVVVNSVWLKADGSIVIANSQGVSTIAADGTMSFVGPQANFTVAASGAITGANGSGSFSLLASGVMNINGATIGVDGSIVSPVSVSAPAFLGTGGGGGTLTVANANITTGLTSPSVQVGGKELANHTHPAGSPPGNTGVNN